MIIFLTQLIFPVLIALASFFILKTVNWKEFLVGLAVQCVIAGATVGIILSSNTSDTEVWSGTVASKTRQRVSCDHSYDCMCVTTCTGSGKDETCSETCQTCYDHDYDVDWFLTTTNGERINIRRINEQGTKKPPRWEAIVIGEPTAVTHTFDNYIKAAPGTLFKREGFEGFKLPKYPNDVYDYYRLNRLTGDGMVQRPALWNKRISEVNGEIAAKTQSNLIVVVTKQGHDFFYALQQKWLGGKKNDVILVIGTDGVDIIWADVLAWSQNEDIKVQLRGAVMDIGKMDREKILGALKENTLKHYKRRPMKDFEYLKSSITPTPTQWVVSLIIGALVAFGLAILFHKNDFFEPQRFRSRFRRGRYY